MKKKIAGLAALLSFAATNVVAQTCEATPVQASAKVRELQSMLMVGALQCRAVPGNTIIADYNRFIAMHKATLQNHNMMLRSHFMKASSKSGASAFDAFTTRLANAQAQATSSAGYCNMIGQLAQTAADVPSEQLADFAMQMLPESAACISY